MVRYWRAGKSQVSRVERGAVSIVTPKQTIQRPFIDTVLLKKHILWKNPFLLPIALYVLYDSHKVSEALHIASWVEKVVCRPSSCGIGLCCFYEKSQ